METFEVKQRNLKTWAQEKYTEMLIIIAVTATAATINWAAGLALWAVFSFGQYILEKRDN